MCIVPGCSVKLKFEIHKECFSKKHILCETQSWRDNTKKTFNDNFKFQMNWAFCVFYLHTWQFWLKAQQEKKKRWRRQENSFLADFLLSWLFTIWAQWVFKSDSFTDAFMISSETSYHREPLICRFVLHVWLSPVPQGTCTSLTMTVTLFILLLEH